MIKTETLNDEQKSAVTHGEGPLMILAGAGSGKTRVLTNRAAWLIQDRGVDPSSIALLTFTNKAAGEMKTRMKSAGNKTLNLGFAGTFHTFCAKLLREFGFLIGVNRNFVIYDSDDSESLMKEVLKNLAIDPKQSKPAMFLALIGRMKNDLVTVQEADKTAKDYFYRQLAKVWRDYQERLKKNNAVDFDDLLILAVELLKIREVKSEINKRLQWILVDEYQDTNKAQFELTKNLAGEKKNITIVGDSAQAIYSFRGADYRNLKLFESAFPNLKEIGLPKNYRSTQTILDAAYSVVSNNTSHPTVKLSATRERGEAVTLYEALDERDEARYVASEAEKRSKTEGEVAILYRVNSQSRSIEDELLRRDVPYKLIGGLRFYNRAEVKDLIAYLRLVMNEGDEVSKTRIEKIGKRKAAVFFEWLEKHKPETVTESPEKVLEEIIHRTNYLEKFDDRDEEDASRLENINELLAVAGEYNTIEQFLESAALSEAEVKQHRSNAKISLMTVHAAKGLEFESVFVIGLEEGLFPHSRSITLGGKDELEEERRLMYVAMTRAKKNLALSFARSRLYYGGRQTSIPSRFLAEIDSSLINRKDSRASEALPSKKALLNEFGEKKRIIVQDWEIAEETVSDFADIDNW